MLSKPPMIIWTLPRWNYNSAVILSALPGLLGNLVRSRLGEDDNNKNTQWQ